MNEFGAVYKVTFELPESVGLFSRRFVLYNENTNIEKIARYVVKNSAKEYNFSMNEVTIKDIQPVHEIHKNQKQLIQHKM